MAWSATGGINSDDTLTPRRRRDRTPARSQWRTNPAADVSGDGSVTSSGAPMILQAAAGAIEL